PRLLFARRTLLRFLGRLASVLGARTLFVALLLQGLSVVDLLAQRCDALLDRPAIRRVGRAIEIPRVRVDGLLQITEALVGARQVEQDDRLLLARVGLYQQVDRVLEAAFLVGLRAGARQRERVLAIRGRRARIGRRCGA